jgi:cell division protein FtsW (lipid II flippase)
VFGPNGSGDAVGTWLILMLLGTAGCAVGGALAYSGRWRRWYRPVDSPIRYAPLAAIPFGIGCLIELVATLFPLADSARQAVVIALFICLLLSLLLFLWFPSRLLPGWIRRLDMEVEGKKERATSEGGPAAR